MIREIGGFFNEFGVGLFERASEKNHQKGFHEQAAGNRFWQGWGAVFTPGGRYDKSAAVQAHYVQGMRSFALDEVESAKTQVAVAPTVQSAAPATKTEAQARGGTQHNTRTAISPRFATRMLWNFLIWGL